MPPPTADAEMPVALSSSDITKLLGVRARLERWWPRAPHAAMASLAHTTRAQCVEALFVCFARAARSRSLTLSLLLVPTALRAQPYLDVKPYSLFCLSKHNFLRRLCLTLIRSKW
jgi:hypothetical protein